MEQDTLCISWNSLPWKKFHRKSSSLQRKIYEAKQNENEKNIKRLQKLLLRSKSLYYTAVKRVTDRYSRRGIFLSAKVKLDLVNEIYTKLFRWKHLLLGGNRTVKFMRWSYLKDEVTMDIWDYLIAPVFWKANCYESESFNKKICIKEKRFSILASKKLFPRLSLGHRFFRCLKSFLTLQTKYKFSILRSLTSITPILYFRSFPLNFRLDLYFRYTSIVSEVIEKLKGFCLLDRHNYGQKESFFDYDENLTYFVNTGVRNLNILFRCKCFFKTLGLKISFNTCK